MKKFKFLNLQSPSIGFNSYSFPPVGILRHAVSLTAPRGLRSTGFFMPICEDFCE
jgi:hypothetical protein